LPNRLLFHQCIVQKLSAFSIFISNNEGVPALSTYLVSHFADEISTAQNCSKVVAGNILNTCFCIERNYWLRNINHLKVLPEIIFNKHVLRA